MNKVNASLLALLLSVSVAAWADDRPHVAAPASSAPVYFAPATFDPRAFLPPPPPNNSERTTKDVEAILQAQADRTQAQVDRIQQEAHYNVFDFQNVVGPWFTPGQLAKMPATNTLLARVIANAVPIVSAAKSDWSRQRPFQVNSRIITVGERPTDSSYPSAHAVRAMLDALVLAQIVPGDSNAIFARGAQIGNDRVIAGVHFPSDVIAGRKLAQAIYNQMAGQKEFQDDVKAARTEIAAYLRKRQG